MDTRPSYFDYVLVGGGLQSGLLALALMDRQPRARIALVEAGPRLGGNHTWCFHEEDVPAGASPWVTPLVEKTWPSYRVAFPAFDRTFTSTYAVVTSSRLDRVVQARLRDAGHTLLLESRATDVGPSSVTLADGRSLRGRLVVDARGPLAQPGQRVAWQKFVGLELGLSRPSPITVPTMMDATVEQDGGYRFFYVLPLDHDRVLVEDTYYADDPDLDPARLRTGIHAYARALGLEVSEILREEQGALPLPLVSEPMPEPSAPLLAGYRGRFFHPTTGYSFPAAVRLAAHVAAHAPEDALGPAFADLLAEHGRQARFAVLLNRLLFGAVAADRRRDVLERFHRLPEATVRRFYAMTTTRADRARILCGKPPRGISMSAAFRELLS